MRRLRKELWHGKASPRTSCKGLAGTARRVAGRLVMALHGRLGRAFPGTARSGTARLGKAGTDRQVTAPLGCAWLAVQARRRKATQGQSRRDEAGYAGPVRYLQGFASNAGKAGRRWALRAQAWRGRQRSRQFPWSGLMPSDVAMCAHTTCPLAPSCRRNTASGAVPSERQSWAGFEPRRDGECDGFWPAQNWEPA